MKCKFEGAAEIDQLIPTFNDMEIAAEAFSRYGLFPAAKMDAACLLRDERNGFTWPDRSFVPLEQLCPVHRVIFTTVSKASAVVGVHTKMVKAVAELADSGVRPLTQDGALFYDTVAVCDSIEEAPKALQAVPQAVILMIRGQGMYAFGPSVAAVFVTAFFLDLTCRVQLLLGSRRIVQPDFKVMAGVRDQLLEDPNFAVGVMEWPALTAWVREVEMPLKEGQRECDAGSQEQTLRLALSIAHKEVARRKADMMVWNHISAKLGDGILITPGDRMWHQMDPNTLKFGSDNVTADILHSAVYSSTEMTSVCHLHTPAIQAVACLEEGFVAPEGSEFVGRVAYHPWEGFSDDPAECPRVAASIAKVPGCKTLILTHHGAITFGNTVEEAFERYWRLDAACRQQLLTGGATNVALIELLASGSV